MSCTLPYTTYTTYTTTFWVIVWPRMASTWIMALYGLGVLAVTSSLTGAWLCNSLLRTDSKTQHASEFVQHTTTFLRAWVRGHVSLVRSFTRALNDTGHLYNLPFLLGLVPSDFDLNLCYIAIWSHCLQALAVWVTPNLAVSLKIIPNIHIIHLLHTVLKFGWGGTVGQRKT